MNLKGSFCWVLMWSGMVLLGQQVSIEAINPDYNGKTIHTIVAWNPFITSLEYTASVICNGNGKFEQELGEMFKDSYEDGVTGNEEPYDNSDLQEPAGPGPLWAPPQH